MFPFAIILDFLPSLGAFLFFGLHHSVLADPDTKEWVFNRIPWASRVWRALYSFVSLVLFALFYLLLPPDRWIWTIPEPYFWAFRGLQFIGIGIVAGSFLYVDRSAFVGLKQIVQPPSYLDEPVQGQLIRSGLHRFVRHPIYTGILMYLIFDPILTRNGIFVAILAALYIVIGYRHEEIGLIRRFGSDYEEYRRQVPALFPKPTSLRRSEIKSLESNE